MGVPTDSDRFPRDRPAMVSVVIPARNAADLLPTQLAALSRQDYEHGWEVVVVDNGSTDGTAEVAVSWKNRLPIRTVQALEKPGVSYARNIGVRSARGDLVAFCDADDEVSDGWLRSIVEVSLESDAVGGAIESSRFNDPEVLPLRTIELTTHLALAGDFLPFASSCNLSIWTDVFATLDGFNEEYAYGAPDVEFSWRLQMAGYRLGFSQQALIHYRPRDDLRAMARQFYHYGRGGARLYRDFRSAGMPRCSIRNAVKGWVWLVLHAPDLLRDRSRRGGWVRIASGRAGKVVGSIEHRTFYL